MTMKSIRDALKGVHEISNIPAAVRGVVWVYHPKHTPQGPLTEGVNVRTCDIRVTVDAKGEASFRIANTPAIARMQAQLAKTKSFNTRPYRRGIYVELLPETAAEILQNHVQTVQPKIREALIESLRSEIAVLQARLDAFTDAPSSDAKTAATITKIRNRRKRITVGDKPLFME